LADFLDKILFIHNAGKITNCDLSGCFETG
jgi:hypothetical protein